MRLADNIFYSTGCLKGPLEQRIEQWSFLEKTNIEISYPFHKDGLIDYILFQKRTNNLRILIHNYLPFDKHEFVLNLGSLNNEIYFRSIEFAKKAIKLTADLDEKIYSLHSPFLFDPHISKLGATFKKDRLYPKNDVLDRFNHSIYELSRFAKELGIQLIFENNVVTRDNYEAFGCNPLIFSSLQDLEKILPLFDEHNVGILLDIGHLLVSAKTFNFNKEDFVKRCGKRIKGLHLSTNDKYSDQNLMPTNFETYEKNLIENVTYASFEVSMASYEQNGEVCLNT